MDGQFYNIKHTITFIVMASDVHCLNSTIAHGKVQNNTFPANPKYTELNCDITTCSCNTQ